MEAFFTIFLPAFLLSNLALGIILWLRVRKLYSYPGKLGYPVIGNLYYFYKTLFIFSSSGLKKYLEELTAQYGDQGIFFHWAYGHRTMVTITCPHIVKEIGFHPNLADKPEFIYEGFHPYMDGPFNYPNADNIWKQRRKEYNVSLKRSLIDNNYFNSFTKAADKIVDLMLSSPSAVNAHHNTSSSVLMATVETLFGCEPGLATHPDVVNTMAKISSIATYVCSNPKVANALLTLVQPLNDVLYGKTMIMLNEIMETVNMRVKGNSVSEKPLSDQITSRCKQQNKSIKELMSEIQELFLISSHTVTSCLGDSIVFLATLPEIQERAWKEQYEIFGNDNRDPTMEDLEQMVYLDRYIKESLRFLSVPYIAKLATEDINTNGIKIPKGTAVVFLMGYMRFDPKYWKDPEVFDPDRFLEESSDMFKYFYTPFGIGVRNCPGYYFANLLMKMVLSKILRRLKLRTVQKDFQFKDLKYNWVLMTEIMNAPMLQVEERT